MNSRATLIMAVIFALALTGVLILNKSDNEKKELKELEGKLLNITKENVNEIILQPSNIHIIKDGEQWKVTHPVETIGNKSNIEALINMFNWAKIERNVSDVVADYPEFGLEPANGKMIILHNDGADTLFLGDDSPTGSFVFVRKTGSPNVFLTTTSLKTNIEKELFDLRDQSVLTFDKNSVKELHIKNGRRKISAVKEAGTWNLKGSNTVKADDSEIEKIIDALESEKAKEFVEENPTTLRKYKLDNPTLTIDLVLGAEKSKKTLEIGKADSEFFFARDVAKNPVMKVDSAFVSKFNVTQSDLRDKKLTELSKDDFDMFEINHGQTTIVCVKDSVDTWQVLVPEEREAKSWKVSSITREAVELKVQEFVSDNPTSLNAFGLTNPAIEAKFYKNNEPVFELLFGKSKGELVYVKTGSNKSVYLVENDILETLTIEFSDIAKEIDVAADSAVTN